VQKYLCTLLININKRYISGPTGDENESYGFDRIQRLAVSFRYGVDERSINNAGMSKCKVEIPWWQPANV
jgi:hypothetical protein